MRCAEHINPKPILFPDRFPTWKCTGKRDSSPRTSHRTPRPCSTTSWPPPPPSPHALRPFRSISTEKAKQNYPYHGPATRLPLGPCPHMNGKQVSLSLLEDGAAAFEPRRSRTAPLRAPQRCRHRGSRLPAGAFPSTGLPGQRGHGGRSPTREPALGSAQKPRPAGEQRAPQPRASAAAAAGGLPQRGAAGRARPAPPQPTSTWRRGFKKREVGRCGQSP